MNDIREFLEEIRNLFYTKREIWIQLNNKSINKSRFDHLMGYKRNYFNVHTIRIHESEKIEDKYFMKVSFIIGGSFVGLIFTLLPAIFILSMKINYNIPTTDIIVMTFFYLVIVIGLRDYLIRAEVNTFKSFIYENLYLNERSDFWK